MVGNNCLTALHYQIFNISYKSPFINFFIFDNNLLCNDRLLNYINQELLFIPPAKTKHRDLISKDLYNTYPVGLLDDIELHFLHDTSENEILEKWNRRKKRFNPNELILITMGSSPVGATTDFYKVIIELGKDSIVTFRKKTKVKYLQFPTRKGESDWEYWSYHLQSLYYKAWLLIFIKFY